MTTTTDQAPLSPAEYTRALGHLRLLASQQVTAELDQLKARRKAIADSKRRLDEAEAALATRRRHLMNTPPAHCAPVLEPTTPIHPAAAALQAPEPPETLEPEPAPTTSTIRPRTLPVYKPAPSPKPRLPLPHLDAEDPESVRKWAMRRWPDPPKRARVRLRLAAADAELWNKDGDKGNKA